MSSPAGSSPTGAATVFAELAAWFANITRRWGQYGETGVDISLLYHTPVYALTTGPVLNEGYYGGGGVVSIADTLNGATASVYYQHLSDIVVTPGQQVEAGQLIGYSGGQIGYGDHPSTTQYSNGPHIEVGINAPYGTATTGLWRPQGANVNPVPFLQQTESNAAAGIVNGFGPVLGGVFDATSADIATGVSTGISSGIDNAVSGLGSGLLGAVNVSSLPDLLWRAGLIAVGVVVVIVALLALSWGNGGQQATEVATRAAMGGA